MFLKNLFFRKNSTADDEKKIALNTAKLLSKKRYLEQNLSTPIIRLLELLQTESFNSTYFGIPTIKSPLDFWVYLEIIFEVKPDIIIEIGNYHGGSTLAFAHMLDNIGKGKVVGIDIDHNNIPDKVKAHPRVTLITGDACQMINSVKALVNPGDSVLVIEDSAHTFQNTLAVLRTYGPLVTANSYFIVEDSICHHGLNVGFKPGVYEAIEAFISDNQNFHIDRGKERFLITWNPKGYLKKIK